MARGQVTLWDGLDPQEIRITFDGKVVRKDANILETVVTLAGIASMRPRVKLAIKDMFDNFPSRSRGDEVIVVARQKEDGGATLFHSNHTRTGLTLRDVYDELRTIVNRRGPVWLRMTMPYVSLNLMSHFETGYEVVESEPKKKSRRHKNKRAKK